MRYAALMFGLVAGALGLWLGLVARDAAGFDLARAGVSERMLILVGLFIVPAISIVGAVFSLIDLRVSAAAMIASAIGWLGIGLLTGNSVTPLTGAAMLLSAIGGIWAVLAMVLGANEADDGFDARPARGGNAGRRSLFAENDSFEPRREPDLTGGRVAREEPSFDDGAAPARRSALGPDPYDRRFSNTPLARLAAQQGGRAKSTPPRRKLFAAGGTFMRFAAFGQTLAAVAVIGGVGSLLVYDYLRGPSSLLFANYFIERPAASAPANREVVRQQTAAAAPVPARTVEPERLLPRPPPAIVPPSVVFDDPAGYCVQMVTDHNPDVNAVRQDLPEDLVRTLRQVRGDMNAAVRWRCADKRLYVCVQVGGPVCEMTPDTAGLNAHCAANPGAKGVRVAAGTFNCDGNRAVVPTDQSWTIDRYGFLPRAWVAASPG